MQIRDILPSRQFMIIAASIAASGGLIAGAYLLTHHAAAPAQTVAVDTNIQENSDWKAQLDAIQAQSPANKAPQGPSADKVNELLNAATSNNLTDTVARTLLVNLSNAKAQGLGNDTPTQDQLIAQAVAQISNEPAKLIYTNADLTLTSNTPGAMLTFGNAFMAAVAAHPGASYDTTIYIVGTTTDNGDATKLRGLKPIGAEYAALAKDLSKVPVPSNMAPIDLQIINNIERMSETFPDIENLYGDSLRGLASFQLYDALNQETLRLFINIAQEFSQDGILFSKGDPGQAWSALVP